MAAPISTYISSEDCPLCGQFNNCANLSADKTQQCWCMQDSIEFSKQLLAQVERSSVNQACICEACAKAFNQTQTTNE